MASVREVARVARVSAATVSRSLNNHPDVDPSTRDRVIAAANKLGYVRSFGRLLTTVVGLVYPNDPGNADYGAFDASLTAGVLRGLNELKFDLKIVNLQRDKSIEETYTQFFMRKGLRGVILRTQESKRYVCEAIADEGFPSIVVADRFEHPKVNFICCDSSGDSRRAVEHLLQLGHRRIACAVHRVPDTDHRDRREAYFAAVRSAGLEVDPSLVVDIVASFDGGAAVINRLMGSTNPPTAIFFTNPLSTLGALRRCQELEIAVPGQLSIIGFDDSDIRLHIWPQFTAICQDASMLGAEAARWLARSLTEEVKQPLRRISPTTFEINLTTSRPPAKRIRVLADGTRVPIAPE
jgi:DNA-binding LacI/PurR family transcriptional regulator